MTKQILKTVLAGILAGVALFMMPFVIIRIVVFFLLIKAIFRLMGSGRNHGRWRYAWANKYQNITEEERKTHMQKYGYRCGHYSKSESSEADPNKSNNDETNEI